MARSTLDPTRQQVPAAPGAAAASAAAIRSSRAVAPWRNRIVGHGEEAPDALVANPRNWRTHPVAQRDALRGSLDSVGWVADVLVNRSSGYVVDGHARIEEAIRRHEPTVPVTYVDLSDDEERVVLATLDPIGAMASADQQKLDALLRDLAPTDAAIGTLIEHLARQNDIDLRSTGLTDPDSLPSPPAETEVYVQPGDLWLLGDHRLLCGDATKPADVARLLDGAEPTLLATDPPYGVSLDPTWRDRAGYNGLGAAEQPYMRISGNDEEIDATRANVGGHVRTEGHRNTTLSGDTRVDWSEAFALVPSLAVGYVWHAGVHAAEVALGLQREPP